jgi:hypothetical protein
VREPPAVHHNGIAIPEIDRRQVVGQDLLRFYIVRAPLLLIGIRSAIVEQRVEPRVGVVTAVRPARRKTLRRKCMSENIRLLIAADPTQGIELECAACYIGVKRSEFEAAQIECDSHPRELLLKNCGAPPAAHGHPSAS